MSKVPGLHFNSGEVPFPPLSITITSPEALKALRVAMSIAVEETGNGSAAESVAVAIMDACTAHARESGVQL